MVVDGCTAAEEDVERKRASKTGKAHFKQTLTPAQSVSVVAMRFRPGF